MQQKIVFDTQSLSQICPEEQRESYKLLGQKLQEAKDFEDKLHHMNDEDHEWEKLQIQLDCTPHNIKNSKYIIVRHALAWHNYFKRATEFRDRNIYSYELMDPPLHYLGKKQCEKMRPEINQMEFDKVYISPLLRTIQTAQLLFQDHPQRNQIQFILCPHISEKISSQYSIYKWGNLTNILQDNTNPIKFDMSEMPEEYEFWQFMLIGKQEKLQGLKPYKEDQEQYLVNKFVKKGKNIALEKKKHADKRVKIFLEKLKNNQTNAKIGIVSHSQIIKIILSLTNKIIETKIRNGTVLGINI
ncbi:unnamed protein product [Paramecium primaurelia]|uniref:Uncharacterized protein n=2 Tax=Paramecium TaxID=5884 RepID=A0A8S1UV87_9CILI|nr:unnamed protein product [Paramecium primaurelia]CAD8166366.1 unnamed protein product [Paramecium pentaurelia]